MLLGLLFFFFEFVTENCRMTSNINLVNEVCDDEYSDEDSLYELVDVDDDYSIDNNNDSYCLVVLKSPIVRMKMEKMML